MSNITVDRRKFLKMLGWGGAGTALTGCDLPTTITLEEGKEEVVSYLSPEEYVIPGVGVWYSSTCTQCDAACGMHGRVREGRPLKLEGNPDSPVNHGKICMMGQGGLQAHYNPDRITAPMIRKGGRLETATWDEALSEVSKAIGNAGTQKVAFVSGTVSGHQSVLISELLNKTNSSGSHYPIEVVNTAVWSSVCRDMLGDAMPRMRFDKAGVILSFGADFLGAWMSPVHMAGEYAKFRNAARRGVLIQVEPKMTLTGGNADLWIAAKPGTEGALALGIASFIIDRGWNKVDVPAVIKDALKQYDLEKVAEITGIEPAKIKRIAGLLSERAPALVLAGGSATGGEHGYQSASAAMLLNIILGAAGNTLEAADKFPEASLAAKAGNTANLVSLAKALESGKHDVVFFYNTNPVYLAPKALKMEQGLERAKLKVAFAQFPDETTLKADVVLPIYSTLEDWGTHTAVYNGGVANLSVQQPLTEALHKDTRGFGDIMISLLKTRDKSYDQFADYYAYLRTAMKNASASVSGGQDSKSEAFWNGILQKGVLAAKGAPSKLAPKMEVEKFSEAAANNDFPMTLIPAPRLGLWDGRHANIPWLQEAPDQIAKVVWGSWAELHPHTAEKLGVANGDYVKITSAQGAIETQVYVHKGVHPNVVAVPLGQGHEDYGRYAKERGVNPLSILTVASVGKSGELATYSTRVSVTKVRKHETLVKMGSSETQMGRKIVRTVSADTLRKTEGEV